MEVKKALKFLIIFFLIMIIVLGYLYLEMKNIDNKILKEESKLTDEIKTEDYKDLKVTKSESSQESEERIKAADELMSKMISEASTSEWETGREDRIKAADELMQKQIVETDATKWEAEKEARIKAADELMQKLSSATSSE